MSLQDELDTAFKAALKNQDSLKLSVLRMLRTALKNRAVELRRPLGEAEILAVINSQVKQRREAAGEYKRGGRLDLAHKEEEELQFLLSFLPTQLTGAALEQEVAAVIQELAASGPGDLGKVMKAAMARLAGRAEGKEVNAIARRLLGA